MKCKDFEVCSNEHDDRYTMDFTDVKPGAFIYWCSSCGPGAHEVEAMLMKRLNIDAAFAKEFNAALTHQENEVRKGIN